MMNMGYLTSKKYTEEVNKLLLYVVKEEDKLISKMDGLYKDINKLTSKTD